MNTRQETCPDCDEAAKHAYSDATTPGFFSPKCAKHRDTCANCKSGDHKHCTNDNLGPIQYCCCGVAGGALSPLRTVTDHKFIAQECHDNGCQFLVLREQFITAQKSLDQMRKLALGYDEANDELREQLISAQKEIADWKMRYEQQAFALQHALGENPWRKILEDHLTVCTGPPIVISGEGAGALAQDKKDQPKS
jgi:hypothetical protein